MMETPPTPTASEAGWTAYLRITRSATYGFLSTLPLLVFYEVMIVLVNQGSWGGVRVGAEVWMKQLLAWIGGVGFAVMGVVVLLAGIGIFVAERKKKIPLRPRYFGWIVAESAVYAVVVAFFVSGIIGSIFATTLYSPYGQLMEGIGLQLVLSVGAGVYEELLFRVLLVGGLYLLLRRMLRQAGAAYVLAALVGALLFSAVHYIGALGDVFTLSSFLFRFLFGLMLNVLFLVRGFGVAAWTHALYDVMVTTALLG